MEIREFLNNKAGTLVLLVGAAAGTEAFWKNNGQGLPWYYLPAIFVLGVLLGLVVITKVLIPPIAYLNRRLDNLKEKLGL